MRRFVRDLLLVAGLFTLAGIAATWPLAAHFTTHLPGRGGDSLIFLWNLWHFDKVLSGEAGWTTTLMAWPVGVDLRLHTHAVVHSVLAWPALHTLSCEAAYNFVILLTFPLTGVAGYLLARHFFPADRPAGLLAAFAVTCCSYRYARMEGHAEMLNTAWLLLDLLFLFRFFEGARRRDAAGLAVCYAVTFYTSYYYTIFLAVLTALFLLARLLCDRETLLAPRVLVRFGAAMAAFVLLALPLAIPVAGSLGGAGVEEPSIAEFKEYSLRLNRLLAPNPYHPLARAAMAGDAHPDGIALNIERAYGLSWGVAALAGAGLFGRRLRHRMPARRAWLFLGAGLLLLSLGPYFVPYGHNTLSVGGQPWNLPLPGILMPHLPLLNHMRAPARLAYLLLVVAAMFAAHAFACLRETGASPRARRFAWGCALFMAFEAVSLPYPLIDHTDLRDPPVFRDERAAGRAGPLMCVPFSVVSGRDGYGFLDLRAQYAQVYHGRPTLNAYLSRLPRATYDRFLGDKVAGLVLRTSMEECLHFRGTRDAPPMVADDEREAARAAREQFVKAFGVQSIVFFPGWERKTPLAGRLLLDLFADRPVVTYADGFTVVRVTP